MDRNDIIKELHNTLGRKRFDHTMGVAYTSACLAMSMGYDSDEAYLAGLLHDCGKCMDNDEYIDFCDRHGIEVSEVERQNPPLLHAKAGVYLAREKYGVTDESILSAIRWHTTGHPDMTDLEQIVFTADYIEPGRQHDPELKDIRREAFSDIRTAIRHIYKNTMIHLKGSAKTLDPMTESSYNWYMENV